MGALLTSLVVWLGLVTPYDHAVRDHVDNALLILGVLGLLNTLLLVRSRLLRPGRAGRAALAIYAALSAAAVAVADFGAHRSAGWVVKGGALVLLLWTLEGLARERWIDT